jgi:hypothetical protein
MLGSEALQVIAGFGITQDAFKTSRKELAASSRRGRR